MSGVIISALPYYLFGMFACSPISG